MNLLNYIMKDICKIIISVLFVLQAFTSYAQNKRFSKEQVVEDLLFMDSIIRTVHPEPFSVISLPRYTDLKDSVESGLQDSLGLETAYLSLAPLLASLGDGHSMMLTPYDPLVAYLKSGGKVFPLDVYLDQDKLFVKYDCYTNIGFDDHTEILSINHTDVAVILSDLFKLYPKELYNDVMYNTIGRDLYVLLFYAGYLKDEDIVIQTRQGKETVDYHTQLIPYSTYNTYKKKLDSPAKYQYGLTDDKKTVTIKLGSFMPVPAYYHFIDSLFCDLTNYPVENMIVDIRGNSGGSSDAVDSLMSYLYPDSFKLYSQVYLKVSERLKEKYKSKGESQFLLIKDERLGDLIPEPVNSTVSDKPAVYKGTLQILVDKATYSGAASFANLITQLKRGDVSGIVGGNNIYFGDFLLFKLPHTGLDFCLSTKKFINYKAEPEKRTE